MGLRPARRNENHPRRHPRESGGPFSVRNTMDSRFRGNDVIFGGAAGDEEYRSGLKILRARFSDFRSDSDRTIGPQKSGRVARDRAYAGSRDG
jgi:hypothetical protein